MSNSYEMVVSAKIANSPEFKIPEITTEEISVTLTDTANDIYKKVNQIKQVNKSGCVKISIPKGLGPATDAALDIFYSWNEEGPKQAIVTGVGATLTAVGVVALAGLSSPVTVSGAVLGAITYSAVKLLADHIYDGIWDYGEQVIDWYMDQNGNCMAETSVSNPSDIRDLVTPIYGSVLNGDLNEIEVRVKPNGGGGSGDDGDIEGGGAGSGSTIYTIKSGDTIWGICNANGWSYEDLIELNPWLADRFSKDGKFALIRPGEKLKLPGGGSAALNAGKPDINTPFNTAQGTSPTTYIDPILIDLNNDGIISTTTIDDGTYFDHQNDGFAESSAWVSKEDGILAIDKNNDGIINNGTEIFGDNYIKSNNKKATSGFDALKDLDTNNDNIINAEDTEFSNIVSINFINDKYNMKYNNNLNLNVV